MTPKVVVTGLGATTPIGPDVPTLWANALTGVSGVHSLNEAWVEEHQLPVTFAAKVTTPASTILTRQEQRRHDISTQLGIIAAREAWGDAGAPTVDPMRFAASMATGIGGLTTLIHNWDILRNQGARKVSPFAVPMLMPNSTSAAVSLALGAQVAARTPVSACASGTEALYMAWEMIRADQADVVIAGGTESVIHPITIASFAAMKALSTRNEDPEHASRPYDVDRDGFVMGEGAGALVLESEEHAKARGARIYAELAGAGLSADAHHITAPRPDAAGAIRALQQSLDSAGATATDVVHVNAHATSTPVGDLPEFTALQAIFGNHLENISVSATKSQMGHLLGAAGAVESILTVKAVQERRAPMTINLENQDPDIHLDVVTSPRTLPAGDVIALNNSFGFGGHNVVAAFRNY